DKFGALAFVLNEEIVAKTLHGAVQLALRVRLNLAARQMDARAHLGRTEPKTDDAREQMVQPGLAQRIVIKRVIGVGVKDKELFGFLQVQVKFHQHQLSFFGDASGGAGLSASSVGTSQFS